ncbi:hypothetical protein GCM10022224_059720 [Nonomuraea antimicrobica]|uniref:Glycosyl transferase family 2 n=1 Tax=Nonomuraea antimicrobica TaxID=561173 RepID=A0ABP7CGA7_9ACTN
MATENHHGSHRHLVDLRLTDGEDPPEAGVDAIIVPTIRHPRWLGHATRLATALGCPLVTLHSRPWSKADRVAALMPYDVRYIAIDIDDVGRLNMPDFETTAIVKGTKFERATDLSAKRNIGLLLSHVMGWERVVFLDDDIEVGGHEDVMRAAALLDRYDAVGMHIGGFPDNSVVCHAHRLAGGDQDSFVGGGALAVETFRNPSFFPNVYNEDWFYLLGETSLRRLAVTGMVKQRPYDPFDRAVRARDQEFGDVLAEGVYWLLDHRIGWAAATDTRHWADFLARRRAFILDVLRRVRQLAPGSRPDPRAMEESLRAALGRLNSIEPEFCVRYIKGWREDRYRWIEHLRKHSLLASDVRDALKWLVKDGAAALNHQPRLNLPI